MPPRWLKIAQRWAKILPSCAKIAQRCAKREPRCPKMEPRSAKIEPRWRQDGPKRAPRRGCPSRSGPTWANLGRSWAQLGSPLLARILFLIDLNRFAPTAIQRFSAHWANFGQLGANLGQLGVSWKQLCGTTKLATPPLERLISTAAHRKSIDR